MAFLLSIPTITAGSVLVALAAATTAVGKEPAVQFSYTSVSPDACKVIDRNDDEGGSSTESCPGFAGYGLQILSSDHNSILNVVRGGGQVAQGPSLHDTVVRRHLVEWRFVGSAAAPTATALIFRMDEVGQPKVRSALYVLRLAGRACFIGKASSNAAARILADNLASPCK
jgi:hypothetical protein